MNSALRAHELLGLALGLVGAELPQVKAALEAREPVLIVLDDLDALEQHVAEFVASLKPHRGRTVLVTCRQNVPSLFCLSLGPLSPVASRALLARLRPEHAQDAGLDQLAKILDHLPLALHLAAPWLGRATLPQLLDHGMNLPDLTACIARSFVGLDAETCGWMAELARWGSPLPLDLALSLGDGGLEGLAALESKSLLRLADGQVHLLETVCAYAKGRRLADPDRTERAVQWAADTCQRARDSLCGPAHAQAITATRDNLQALLRVLDQGSRCETWGRAVLHLSTLLMRIGPTRELDAWLQEAESVCEAALVPRCRVERAHLRRLRGQDALDLLRQAPDEADRSTWASWHVQRGIVRLARGDHDAAETDFRAVLEAELGNTVDTRRAWFGLARVRRAELRIDDTIEILTTLEGLSHLAADPVHHLAGLNMRGHVERARGQPFQGEVWLRKAREAAIELGTPLSLALIDKSLATLEGIQGRHAAAGIRLKSAKEVYWRHGLLESVGYVALSQATLAMWMKRPKQALEHLIAAEDAFLRTGFRRGRCAVLGTRGRLFASQGKDTAALASLEEATTFAGGRTTSLRAIHAVCRGLTGDHAELDWIRSLPEVGGIGLLYRLAGSLRSNTAADRAHVREVLGSSALDAAGLSA